MDGYKRQNIKNYNVYTTKFNLYVVDLTQINRHQHRRLSETEITQTGNIWKRIIN